MKRLIVTIAAGDFMNWHGITLPRLYDYARKVGADLHVMTGPTFGRVHDDTFNCDASASWWKLPLIEWFSRQDSYDKMLFLDCDIYIKADAPNVFEEHSGEGYWYCEDMHSRREDAPWREWLKTNYPEINPPEDFVYGNGGVFLTDRISAAHLRMMFEKFPKRYTRWIEQDAMMAFVSEAGVGKVMHPRYNWYAPHMTQDIAGGSFIHANGVPNGERLGWFEKMAKAEKHGRSKL